jgi:hypothetical protein
VSVVLLLELAVTGPVQLAGAGVGAVEELDEADVPLDEPPREDTIPGEGGLDGVGRIIGPVEPQHVGGLAGEVGSLRHAALHSRGELVAGDPGRERLVPLLLVQGAAVHTPE